MNKAARLTTFLILITLPLIASATKVLPVGLLKYCDRYYETLPPRENAYLLDLVHISLKGSRITAHINFSYLSCKQVSQYPENYRFYYDSPLRQKTYRALDSKTLVVSTPQLRQLIAYVDGVYDIIAIEDINAATQQNIQISFDLQNTLTRAQFERFKANQVVNVQIDLSLYSQFEVSYNGKSSVEMESSSGIYRLRFKAKSGNLSQPNLSAKSF